MSVFPRVRVVVFIAVALLEKGALGLRVFHWNTQIPKRPPKISFDLPLRPTVIPFSLRM
jgi:hypothetical protein